MSKYFIAIYTHECKSYCDQEFFTRIYQIARRSPESEVWVVDNTDNNNYIHKLDEMLDFPALKADIPLEPQETKFLRNVTNSVNKLREVFLYSNKVTKPEFDYFLIIESDVKPPEDLLERFDKTIERIENLQDAEMESGKWDGKYCGALGALYYTGFHDYTKQGLQETHHVLSGCTVYKRELIEKQPFRWSKENQAAFPDAWMSVDAGNLGYKLYNDHDIQCEHIHNKNGSRYT